MVVLPYMGQVSQKLKRICEGYKIRTVFSSNATLRRELCQTAPPSQITDTKNCVYSIPSVGCDQVYIGQTKRPLKDRIAEHKRALTKGECGMSGVAEHCWNHQHGADWDEVRVLCREPRQTKREFRETMEMIKAGRHSYATPSLQVSNIWKPLIEQRAATNLERTRVRRTPM